MDNYNQNNQNINSPPNAPPQYAPPYGGQPVDGQYQTGTGYQNTQPNQYPNQQQPNQYVNYNTYGSPYNTVVKKKSSAGIVLGVIFGIILLLGVIAYVIFNSVFKTIVDEGYLKEAFKENRENSLGAYDRMTPEASEGYDDYVNRFGGDSEYSEESDVMLEQLTDLLYDGNTDEFRMMLKNAGSDFDVNYYNYDYYPILYSAIDNGKYDIMTMLINEYDADPNISDYYDSMMVPICFALYVNDYEAIKVLVENGADIDETGEYTMTPLMYSTKFDYKSVKTLVDLGADATAVDDYGWGLLHYAAKNGTAEIYDFLVENGADERLITDEGFNVGHTSIMSGDVIFVEYILGRGFELNQPMANGDTLLHLATTSSMAKYIMKNYDYDINAKGEGGMTPLHIAAYYTFDADTVKQYLENGATASVNVKDDYDETPLFYSYDDYDITKLLIENGADINARNNYEATALMYAVEYESVVQLLIENGADIAAEDEDGDTAYDYAVYYSDETKVTDKTLGLLQSGTTV